MEQMTILRSMQQAQYGKLSYRQWQQVFQGPIPKCKQFRH